MTNDSVVARPHDSVTAPVSARRTFLARFAGLVAALPVVGRRLASPVLASVADSRSAPPSAYARQPNATLLAAVGAAILPTDLGTDGTRRAVSEFQRWMDESRPGAEANHGYGTGRIQRLPADPRPRWRSQLAALDQNARRMHGRSFASLSRADQQAMLRTALAEDRDETLPPPLAARHIAVAMLAHFYDSPAATDLCYEANIGRQLCRPLSAASQQPVPLTRRAQ